MPSPVVSALEAAMYAGSSPKGRFWVFKHPNPDAPPQTFRLTRRSGNGWTLLLAASKATGEILAFHAETPEDQTAVKEALKWLGIKAELSQTQNGVMLLLPGGRSLPSQLVGGEKPKKKA